MSVVSLASAKTRSYTEDSGRGNTSLTQKTTRRVDVRQDIDRRRIIYERSSPHSGRPVTAPQITPLRNNAEPSSIGDFSVDGPKVSALKSQAIVEKKKLSSPKTMKVRGGLSPKPGHRTPITKIRVDTDFDKEEHGESSFMITTSTLNNHQLMKEVMNGRDQKALKLGRLLLSTVLDQEDAANEDIVSRFFFDNWLRKSGGDFKKSDTWSIEVMTQLQKNIAEAKAVMYDDEEQSEVKHEENGSEIDPSDEDLGVPVEKRAVKMVGLVALEALDKCVAEFGQANPVLKDIRDGLLPLLFTAPPAPLTENADDGDEVMEEEKTEVPYRAWRTWLEDSHQTLGHYYASEEDRAQLQQELVKARCRIGALEEDLKREFGNMQPFKDRISSLELDQERHLAMLEDCRAIIGARDYTLALKNANISKLHTDIELGKEREQNKDSMVKELTETIAQMERDKLPDIREEYAAALADVERLRTENTDLEDACRNQKIMLDMAKEADVDAERNLIKAASDHQLWSQVLFPEKRLGEGQELGEEALELKASFDEANEDQQRTIRRRTEKYDDFFQDTSRALTSGRYIEYLEHVREACYTEIEEGNVEKTAIRMELQEVKDNEQCLIDEYEAKIVELVHKHEEEMKALRQEIASLMAIVEEKEKRIAVLDQELTDANRLVTELTEKMSEAQNAIESLQIRIKEQESEISSLKGRVEELGIELAETREELEDIKRELEETIQELRETDEKLRIANSTIDLQRDQLAMLLEDQWMAQRVESQTKKGAILRGQLDFAQTEIVNLKERATYLEGEVSDLTDEVRELEKAREEDADDFERRTKDLNEQVESQQEAISAHLNTISVCDIRIAFLIGEREREMMVYEDTLAKDIIEADKLHDQVTDLTDERNQLTLDKRKLESELITMLERAEIAEAHWQGSDDLAVWLDERAKRVLSSMQEIARNYNPDEFDNDNELDDVELKLEINQREQASRLTDDLKDRAVSFLIHIDQSFKDYATDFVKAIKDLQNSLSVSRKVIAESNSVSSLGRQPSIDSSGMPSTGPMEGGLEQGSLGSWPDFPRPRPGHHTKVPHGDGHLMIVTDGWKTYDPEVHALMLVEETPVKTEILHMMREDAHAGTTKDVILDFVLDKARADLEAAAAEMEKLLAKEGSKDDMDKAEEQIQASLSILETAAADVEREEPLRERIKTQEEKIATLENTLSDLELELDESNLEMDVLRKSNNETLSKFKELTDERDDMQAKFEQAMKALHSSEEKAKKKGDQQDKEESQKTEGEESKKPKRSIQEIINANKGNPKKMVQPFVHFIRRNENEILRHMGQQSVMMREVKHLVERVLETFGRMHEEESRFYYRKHHTANSHEDNCATLIKLWDIVRDMTKDIHNSSQWVFETHDFAMGADTILTESRVIEGSSVDPMKAIGTNHVAAAYESHLEEVKKGEDNVITDILDEDEDPQGLRKQLEEGLDALAESVRHDSRVAGGWRAQLYNLDGSVDMDMPVKDWSRDDKIHILGEKLRFSQELLQKERDNKAELVKRMKEERATVERKMDELQDEMDRLQKEYGSVGIEHDFYVYKRVKQGILDGSLAQYNLDEIIYNPQDFIEIESAVFKTVSMLLSLSKNVDSLGGQAKEETVDALHNPALTVAFDSKTVTPAGDTPPYVVDAPPPHAGPRPSTTGNSRQPATAKMTMLATKQAPLRGTRPPRNEWMDSAEDAKRKKRLEAHNARQVPAVYAGEGGGGAHSGQIPSISRAVVPADFQWPNEKTKSLVALLDDACKSISLRVLYGKVLDGHGEMSDEVSVTSVENIAKVTAEPDELVKQNLAREKSDVRKFVKSVNKKVNKHIHEAKVLESVIREVEDVITSGGSGGLDMEALKRIYEARMARAQVDKEEIEESGVIEKPPASLARAAHVNRDDHHHLVQEAELRRQFLSKTWTGRPSSPGDVRSQDSEMQPQQLVLSSASVESLSKFQMLESRVGVNSKDNVNHIVSSSKHPRSLALVPQKEKAPFVNNSFSDYGSMSSKHQLFDDYHMTNSVSPETKRILSEHQSGMKMSAAPQVVMPHLLQAKRRDSIFNDSQVSSLAQSRRDSLDSVTSGPLVLEGVESRHQEKADVRQLASRTEDTLDEEVQSQVSAPPPTGAQPPDSSRSVTLLVKDMNKGSLVESLGSLPSPLMI